MTLLFRICLVHMSVRAFYGDEMSTLGIVVQEFMGLGTTELGFFSFYIYLYEIFENKLPNSGICSKKIYESRKTPPLAALPPWRQSFIRRNDIPGVTLPSISLHESSPRLSHFFLQQRQGLSLTSIKLSAEAGVV